MPVEVGVEASFTMINESDMSLELDIAFPLGEGARAGALADFAVSSDGIARTVFRASGGYPGWIRLERVSGPEVDAPSEPVHDLDGGMAVGESRFRRLMFWRETFAPGQEKVIEVSYSLHLPLQSPTWTRRRELSNLKGIHPDEADNAPRAFVRTLPRANRYLFFDYVLESGASWKGSIGEESVRLRLHPSWSGARLHVYAPGPDGWSSTEFADWESSPAAMLHVFRYEEYSPEPTHALYFALSYAPSP